MYKQEHRARPSGIYRRAWNGQAVLIARFPLGYITSVKPTPVPAVTREFLLYVATLDRRKNHEILYKAYVAIRESRKETPPQCVFVGMPGPHVKELLSDIALDHVWVTLSFLTMLAMAR